ncbi:MAG TPA: HAMP domain-containing sensor histidine kinase [Candidatus Limnocylindrales bacterium]
MTATETHDVRRRSIRVALAATLLVGLAYLVVAAALVAIATNNLTMQIDNRLNASLGHFPIRPSNDRVPWKPGAEGSAFGPQLLAWTVTSDGDVFTQPDNPALPAELQRAVGPQTVTLNGLGFRIRGGPKGQDYVVIGQSMDSVSQARSNIVLAEVLIAPVLLLLVFFGAVTIGRRVATPVELARRRQLEFTADASHELRTPLSVIEANTSLALAEPRSDVWYRTTFEHVDLESKRMRRVLEDMLWLARFDATQGQPHAEPVDVGVLASQTVDRFGAIAATRHQGLEVVTSAEDLVVTAPPEWLDRLLGVLLDNACKYSPDGGTVRVSVNGEGGRIQLTVDDAGPGIPEDERARIFDRFHRATGEGGGAGLGLAIADAIVRATNGRWKIGVSTAGGASMTVSWPRSFAGPREAAARRASPTTEPSART